MENGLIASVQPVRQALAGDVEMFDQGSMNNNQNRFCNRGSQVSLEPWLFDRAHKTAIVSKSKKGGCFHPSFLLKNCLWFWNTYIYC